VPHFEDRGARLGLATTLASNRCHACRNRRYVTTGRAGMRLPSQGGSETKTETRHEGARPADRSGPALPLVSWAVAVGFEPTEACTSHAFEACSFGRSDTPPRTRIHAAG
jgi:hypothetical protein